MLKLKSLAEEPTLITKSTVCPDGAETEEIDCTLADSNTPSQVSPDVVAIAVPDWIKTVIGIVSCVVIVKS